MLPGIPAWQETLESTDRNRPMATFLPRYWGEGSGTEDTFLGGERDRSRGAYEIGRIITSCTDRFDEFVRRRRYTNAFLPKTPTPCPAHDAILKDFLAFRLDQAQLVRRTRQITESLVLYRGISGDSAFEDLIIESNGQVFYKSLPLECWSFTKEGAAEFIVAQEHNQDRSYDGIIVASCFTLESIWIWHDNDLGGEDQAVLGLFGLMPVLNVECVKL